VSTPPALLWVRQDLRLQDNPALMAAHRSGRPVVPLFIHDDAGEHQWAAGGASRWWQQRSLRAFDTSLRKLGSRLVNRSGDTLVELQRVVAETGAGAIFWNRRYEPAVAARDRGLENRFRESGLEVGVSNSALLFEPESIANKSGKPFQVFTPFWRHCWQLEVAKPERFGSPRLVAPGRWPVGLDLDEMVRSTEARWSQKFDQVWQPGEETALTRLKEFSRDQVAGYADRRDGPSVDGTSRLSAALHFGEVSPRQVWEAVRKGGDAAGVFPANNGTRVFLSELGWREFAHHLLVHYPHTPEKPLREKFAAFRWASDPQGNRLRAWQQGLTGYPVVDAGMRQLWATGWMHNRVRMVAGSFLVKHLRLPWIRGAEWFWDTLVDADLANNTLGWQWTAGCGADAAPYFRIFAPVAQGERFDAEGDYVRRWVPELAGMPAKFIHRPWEASEGVLASAGVELGKNYPRPIVDHATARAEALAAFQQLKERP